MKKQLRSSAPFLGLLGMVFTLFCFAPTVSAQQESTLQQDTVEAPLYYRVVTRDGQYFYGRVIREDSRQIVLDDVREGKIFIPRSNVSQIDVYSADERRSPTYKSRSFRSRIPSRSRYPSYNLTSHPAGLGAGNGLVQTSALSLNQLKYGITDNMDFEVGTIFIAGPTFMGMNGHREVIENVHFMGGMKLGYITLFDENPFVLPYLGAGIGGVHNSISIQQGVAFSFDQEAVSVTLIAAQTAFIPHFDLFGEFLFLPQESFYFGQTYLRTTHRKSWWMDIGVVYSEGFDGFGVFPMLGGGYQLR
jgi:hypothetical protein